MKLLIDLSFTINNSIVTIYIKFAFNQYLNIKKVYIDHSKVAFLLSEKQVKHQKNQFLVNKFKVSVYKFKTN